MAESETLVQCTSWAQRAPELILCSQKLQAKIPSPLLRRMSSPQKLAWFLTSKSRWDRVECSRSSERKYFQAICSKRRCSGRREEQGGVSMALSWVTQLESHFAQQKCLSLTHKQYKVCGRTLLRINRPNVNGHSHFLAYLVSQPPYKHTAKLTFISVHTSSWLLD